MAFYFDGRLRMGNCWVRKLRKGTWKVKVGQGKNSQPSRAKGLSLSSSTGSTPLRPAHGKLQSMLHVPCVQFYDLRTILGGSMKHMRMRAFKDERRRVLENRQLQMGNYEAGKQCSSLPLKCLSFFRIQSKGDPQMKFTKYFLPVILPSYSYNLSVMFCY